MNGERVAVVTRPHVRAPTVTTACVFPAMLHSITNDAWSLSAYNASVPVESLRIALRWGVIGLPLVLLYF